MSALLQELITAAITGDAAALRRQPPAPEPLPSALISLLVVAGNDLATGGYRHLSTYETNLARRLFRAATIAVARQLLLAHPELANELQEQEIIKKNPVVGPLQRLDQHGQTVQSQRLVLADSDAFIAYQERGLLGWDNGDAQGAMAIVYGWRKVVTNKRGMLQSVQILHREARTIREKALAEHPHNRFLQLIDAYARLTWTSRARAQRADALTKLELFSTQTATDTHDKSLQLLALAFLLDVYLRAREYQKAVHVLDQIDRFLGTGTPTAPYPLIWRAWAEARGGDPLIAYDLARKVITTQEPRWLAHAAQILEAIDAPATAEQILAQLPAEYLPRPNPLAASNQRLSKA